MSKISWWSKFCALPRFSFLLGEGPSVRKVHDTCGNWIDQSAVSQIVDDMQVEINALRERLDRLKPEGARPFIPQDVEEFIAGNSQTDHIRDEYGDTHYKIDVVDVDDLRAWMSGHVRVPVEPGIAMIDAGVAMALQVSASDPGGWSEYVRALYKQMLNASKGE